MILRLSSHRHSHLNLRFTLRVSFSLDLGVFVLAFLSMDFGCLIRLPLPLFFLSPFSILAESQSLQQLAFIALLLMGPWAARS